MLQFLSESLLNASCEVLLFVLQIYSLYWKRKMKFVLTQLRQARIHNGICDIDGLWSYCSNATVWIVVCFFRILLYGVIFLGTGGRLFPVRNKQICGRSATDLFEEKQTNSRLIYRLQRLLSVCADVVLRSSAKKISCRRETDQKQICRRSVKSVSNLQVFCLSRHLDVATRIHVTARPTIEFFIGHPYGNLYSLFRWESEDFIEFLCKLLILRYPNY